MRGDLILLCSLLITVEMAVLRDKFKFYNTDNFKYLGKFIGANRSKANTHYQVKAKYKRPIESLNHMTT